MLRLTPSPNRYRVGVLQTEPRMPCQPDLFHPRAAGVFILLCIPAFFILVLLPLKVAGQSAFIVPTREAVISVADQKLVVLEGEKKIASFSVSTSKYGSGDRKNSWSTPLGTLRIAQKIGDHVPSGAVFRRRQPTGEIIQPNAPGRDPIISRILWLDGMEANNRNAYERCIYIHGTPEERNIGRPASYGCIRMKSRDVIVLYDLLSVGSHVTIVNDKVKRALEQFASAKIQAPASEAASTRAIK